MGKWASTGQKVRLIVKLEEKGSYPDIDERIPLRLSCLVETKTASSP